MPCKKIALNEDEAAEDRRGRRGASGLSERAAVAIKALMGKAHSFRS